MNHHDRRGSISAAPTDRSSEIPILAPGCNPASYRLDPLSANLLALVDGSRSMADLAGFAGESLATVIRQIDVLRETGLITLVDVFGPQSEPPPAARVDPRRASPARLRQQQATAAPAQPQVDWSNDGDLTRKPFLDVLAEAGTSRFTGTIRFERGGDRIELHFKGGAGQGVTSTAKRHEHGEMLAAAGKIGADQHAVYRAVLATGAAHPVSALMKAGITDRRELARLLTWRGSSILKELAGWKDGTFAQAKDAPFPAGVEALRLVLPRKRSSKWRAVKLTMEQSVELDKRRSLYLVAAPGAAATVASMGLGEKQLRYVEYILAEPIQLSGALATSTLFRAVTRSLVHHLIEIDVFELQETNPEGITPHAPEDLPGMLQALENANHFDVLTTHPISTEKEIRYRYKRRLAEFDPELYPNANDRQRAALKAIRARLDTALAVLADKSRRQAYRRQICSPDQLVIFVDLQIRKAQVALNLRGEAALALELTESALDIEPGNLHSRIVAAGALTALARTREARELVQGIRAVPAEAREEWEALRAKLS